MTFLERMSYDVSTFLNSNKVMHPTIYCMIRHVSNANCVRYVTNKLLLLEEKEQGRLGGTL